MDRPLFAKALAVQGAALLVLFALLVAAPLPDDFFRDWGAVSGPAAWLLCSLATWRVLSLRGAVVAVAALGGGAAGLLALLLGSHGAGMLIALLTFAAAIAVSE